MAFSMSFLCALAAAAVIASVDATFEVGHLPSGQDNLTGRSPRLLMMLHIAALHHAEHFTGMCPAGTSAERC